MNLKTYRIFAQSAYHRACEAFKVALQQWWRWSVRQVKYYAAGVLPSMYISFQTRRMLGTLHGRFRHRSDIVLLAVVPYSTVKAGILPLCAPLLWDLSRIVYHAHYTILPWPVGCDKLNKNTSTINWCGINAQEAYELDAVVFLAWPEQLFNCRMDFERHSRGGPIEQHLLCNAPLYVNKAESSAPQFIWINSPRD